MKCKCDTCKRIFDFSLVHYTDTDETGCPYCGGPDEKIEFVETKQDRINRQLDMMDC